MRPKDTNAFGSVFGGVILSLIDEAAFVEAVRQNPRRYVTIAMNKVVFGKPVHVGDIVTLWAEALSVGRTSMRIRVTVSSRSLRTNEDVTVTTAEVTMVAVDEQGRSVSIAGD
jgi:acyl-CoA thioesterase YciA